MKILLLITSSDEIVNGFQTSLSSEYIVLIASSLEKGSDLIRSEKVNIVAVDIAISGNVASWLNKYRTVPNVIWIGVAPSNLSKEDLDRFYEMFHEVVSAPLLKDRLNVVVRKAHERQEILSEVRHLKLLSVTQQDKYTGRAGIPGLPFEPLEKAVALSRIFTASFDLDKSVNLFIDAVIDVIGVSRVSLMLFDDIAGVYRIKGSRGIHPELISKLYLSSESGMVLWLSSMGRILRRDKVEINLGHKDVLSQAVREMEVLQSIVSIPIICEGRLLCILNLDSKVTGEFFSNTELERIFVLSNYFGKAIQAIYNYHRVCCQKEYIQKILERMGNGVITVNDREEIIIFNPKAEEILKIRAADMIGKSAGSLPPVLVDLIKSTVRDKKTYRKHEVISEEDNLYLEVDTYGLCDISGALIGGVVLLDDITTRKDLNREKEKGENLQVLNELVGRMAHELRNPIVAVRTFTQLMKDRYNDSEFQNFFYTTVTGEVEKLNNLIEKLIAFVHPIEYKFEMVDMGEVLDKCLESVLKGLRTAEFHIVKNYAPGIFKLQADKAQISKAFSYIFQNAFNAMAPGGALTIDIESLSRGGVIKVSIKDTGKGIPKEDIDRVFDPFYTTPEKGVGLGLPLSQKIIEDHKGKVAINSVLNQGTTLTVLLPIAAQTRREV